MLSNVDQKNLVKDLLKFDKYFIEINELRCQKKSKKEKKIKLAKKNKEEKWK